MSRFRKVIILLLIILTVVLAGIAIYVGYKLNQERTSPQDSGATACLGHDSFNSVEECVSSCEYGCQFSDYQQECLNGCRGACEDLCAGGSGSRCGDGSCNPPGENATNCPQDCSGTTGGNTGGDTGGGTPECISCGSITCNDGTTFGPDSCAPQASCDQRAQEACQNHGGVESSGGPNNNTNGICVSGANSCNGKAYNTVVAYQGGSCRCVMEGVEGFCGCLQDGQGNPVPPGGTKGLAETCSTNSDCGYSGSYKLSCVPCGGGRSVCGNPDFPQGVCNVPSDDLSSISACGGAELYSVDCSRCPDGQGSVCYESGWGGCVNADGCGARQACISNNDIYLDGECLGDEICNNGNWESVDSQDVCDNTSTPITGFAGCGDLYPNALGAGGDACANCYQSTNSDNTQNIFCVVECSSCGAKVGCPCTSGGTPGEPTPPNTGDNPPPPDTGPYCGDGNLDPGEQCDYNANPTGCNNGQTCNTNCTCDTSPPPPSAYCGDGNCDAGERCEINGNVACPSGTPLSGGVSCRNNCTYCGDGILDPGEQCEIGISCSNGSYCNESACSCSPITCDSMTRVGTDNVGPNEIEIFNVSLTAGNSEPYPQSLVRLRVSSISNDDPVGRDPSNLSESLVSPSGVASSTTSDPNVYNWSYTFAWQATNVDNSQLINGDYDVEVSFDGGNTWQSSPCSLTFTYDSGEEIEPAFLILKSSSVSCTTSAGADISYTITVTNLGPGAGVIDYVEDQLDPNVNPTWVANIGSSRGIVGQVNGNLIRWEGTVSQRSYDENQSATFSYTLSIPSSSLDTFIQQNGVDNMVTVVYNPDQNRFSLVTPVECSSGTYTLPSTGINDQLPILIALMTILLGLVAYKVRFGQEPIHAVLSNGSSKFVDTLSNLGFAPIIGEVRKGKLEKEFLDDREKKD